MSVVFLTKYSPLIREDCCQRVKTQLKQRRNESYRKRLNVIVCDTIVLRNLLMYFILVEQFTVVDGNEILSYYKAANFLYSEVQ